MEQLPNRRQSLEGVTYDGALLRLSYSIAKQLYRCPGCHKSVEIGSAHTLVQFLSADPRFHQHWHASCASAHLVRELESSRIIQAG